MRILLGLCLLTTSAIPHMALAQPRTTKAVLRDQIKLSAAAGLGYYKRAQVSEGYVANPNWESRSYRVTGGRMRSATGTDTTSHPFADELSFATDLGHDDPALVDFFTRTQRGDTLVAVLMPGRVGKCDLQSQRVVRQAGGPIRYVAAQVLRASTLYVTEADVEIWFDAQGRYLRHTLTVRTRIRLLGSPRQVRITGERR